MRGVVIFLHGFSQQPEAYCELLNAVAAEAKVLIIAPRVPFAATIEKEQVGCTRQGWGMEWAGR